MVSTASPLFTGNGGASIDTSVSGRGGMTNLNAPATEPGPLLDSDFQHFDGTPIPPPPVRCAPLPRSLFDRAARALRNLRSTR